MESMQINDQKDRHLRGKKMKWVLKIVSRKLIKISISFAIIFFVLFNLTYVYRNPTLSHQSISHLVEAVFVNPISSIISQTSSGPSESYVNPVRVLNDEKYIGGLLSTRFNETSCFSRYQSSKYRKPSLFKPSTYLLSKLHNYEELHRRCGPGTQPYNETLRLLELNHTTISHSKCNYVVYICLRHNCGLGNRILTISSAFLYAILTNRVLLIDQSKDTQMMNMHDLFCEPFPASSWFLPQDFPLEKDFKDFIWNHPNCHGNMLRSNLLNNSMTSNQKLPSYLYLHLSHEASHHDNLFFCDNEQTILKNVPWLILRSNLYFTPSLYLIPSFEKELSRLFPNKETIFHHLGRYLFHPTNQVWESIISYYDAYLANVDERVGIQMRSFDKSLNVALQLNREMLSCISKERLLPKLNLSETNYYWSFDSLKNQKSIAVLVTSLDTRYYHSLKELYRVFPTVSREVLVEFYEPSHEETQQSHNQMHERRAWAEMFLLSLTDKLVTSGQSTFGYVAQGLGGLKSWIINQPTEKIIMDPSSPCHRAISIEPCFHKPPNWDCKAKKTIDFGKFVSYIRQCEDINWGVKLVDEV